MNAFCAMMSHELGESLIGTAPTFSTYVLIECPHPWAANEFESKAIPPSLKTLIEQIKLPIRFLLFKGEAAPQTRAMIFRKAEERYRKREIQFDSIEQIAPFIQFHLTETDLAIDCEDSTEQDIFVCTHGSHDKCCAKFGYPFYREASKIATDARVWQVSHIGGHRFAPTIVTFPDGRYYGRLDAESFRAIVDRTGEIQHLSKVYRGWGCLPKPVQVAECAIALEQGWHWFDHPVSYQILSSDSDSMQVRLKGRSLTYLATIAYETKSVVSSCTSNQPTQVTQYSVRQFQQVTQRSTFSQSKLAISR